MTSKFTVNMVVALLVSLGGAIYLTAFENPVPDQLWNSASFFGGALATLLVSTRSGSDLPPPTPPAPAKDVI